jgi:hypothetical protein
MELYIKLDWNIITCSCGGYFGSLDSIQKHQRNEKCKGNTRDTNLGATQEHPEEEAEEESGSEASITQETLRQTRTTRNSQKTSSMRTSKDISTNVVVNNTPKANQISNTNLDVRSGKFSSINSRKTVPRNQTAGQNQGEQRQQQSGRAKLM